MCPLTRGGVESIHLKLMQVRWDDMEGDRCNRVSPWEISPCQSSFGSVSGYGGVMMAGCKRSRFAVQHANNNNDHHHEYPSSPSQ